MKKCLIVSVVGSEYKFLILKYRCVVLKKKKSCFSNVFEFGAMESWNILAELQSRWLQMQDLLCVSFH